MVLNIFKASMVLVFYLCSITVTFANSFTGVETNDTNIIRSGLFLEILKEEAVSRLQELGKVSDADNYLERTFLSPASGRARAVISSWMEDAGLRTWVDQLGNVHGRVEGINAASEALIIGSHLDTVIDAGMFDGSLGIVCAVSAVKVLKIEGKLENIRRPIEVIAFSDEEGVRFQTAFLGSAALAGTLPVSALLISDKSGATVQHALKENSFESTEESLLQLKYKEGSVWGYITAFTLNKALYWNHLVFLLE